MTQWLACLAMKVSRIVLVALFLLTISGCACPTESSSGGSGGSPTGSGGSGGSGAPTVCASFEEDACSGDTRESVSHRCVTAFGTDLPKPVTCAPGEVPAGCESLSAFSPGYTVDCGGGPLDMWCCEVAAQ